MLDQVEFMGGLLHLSTLATRIERHLQIERLHLKPLERERLGRLLKAALGDGEIERGRVGVIIGLEASAAREITRLALREKLMIPTTERGSLSLVFSSENIETYFPKLYQDLPVAAAA